jgi:leader peptidase (prepilin peptidase)/N-methyltransferase
LTSSFGLSESRRIPLWRHNSLQAIAPNATITLGVFSALFGLAVGSFVNVVDHRLPDGGLRSLLGRSHCPKCNATIRWFDNIPVLSWLFLAGKCRDCKTTISFRYPAVEIICGILFFVAWWIGPRGEGGAYTIQLIVTWALLAVLLALSLIDLRLRILPDELTIPTMVAGPIVVALVPGFLTGTWSARLFASEIPNEHLRAGIVSALGVVVGAGSIALVRALGTRFFSSSETYEVSGGGAAARLDSFLAQQKPRRGKKEVHEWITDNSVQLSRSGSARFDIITNPSERLAPGDRVRVRFVREAMGFGDVKLQGGIGAFVGPEGTFLVLALASLAGAVLGSINILRIAFLLMRRYAERGRADRSGLWLVARAAGGVIPFGPFLAAGAAVVLLARERLMSSMHELWAPR